MPDLDDELDLFVERCELAWQASDNVDVSELLPREDHPGYAEIAVELLRVDLEHRLTRGHSAGLDSYLQQFPTLLSDRNRLAPLAFEEYRLRLQSGEEVSPEDYSSRYQVSTANWQDLAEASTVRPDGDLSQVENHPCEDDQLSENAAFGAFILTRELGRGAIARVFLARQTGVADRSVVLKFATTRTVEIDRLGRLQHSNIVPILSVHPYRGTGAAICMPFLGEVTLADIARARAKTETVETRDVLAGVLPAASLVESDLPRKWNDFVLQLGIGITSGLRHAHDRDVVHGDVKPGNILLSDDGRPMLLDFNLAGDLTSLRPEVVGGTFRYMPPEHKDAFQTGEAAIRSDVRSDIYSLGVVLFELLTGNPETTSEATQQKLTDLTSPALAAIVRKCVAAAPADRYQSAAALLEDLSRQAAGLPLRHQPEPSFRERVSKWVRRHPRLASNASLITIFTLILAVGGVAWMARSRQLERMQAQADFRSFSTSVPEACALLAGGSTPEAVEAGIEKAERLLQRVSGPDDTLAVFPALGSKDQSRQREEVGRLLYYLANGYFVRATNMPDQTERARARDAAAAQNRRAADWFDRQVGHVPRAITIQASRIAGEPVGDVTASRADATALDQLLLATELNQSRLFRQTWEYLDSLKSNYPDDLSFWTLLASAYAGGREYEKAETCLTACLALNPDSWVALSDRGLARLALKQFAAAEADFTQVIRVRPDYYGGYLNRALSRAGQGRFSDAVDDLTASLDRGAPSRAWFLRSRYRGALGDRTGASADHRKGLDTVPTDEKSWVSRGLAKLSSDPAGALADFREATKLNPDSLDGLRNIAHVLSERMEDPAGAIEALDRIIDAGIEDSGAYAGRAVLHARAGRVQPAVDDIRRALEIDQEPLTRYQAACVYSLLAEKEAAYRVQAHALLASSMKDLPRVLLGFAERDPDLKAMRETEDWKKLTDAARALYEFEKADTERDPP